MMKRDVDIDALLTPIPGDNPAGENLRYTSIYEEIKEARRADDPLDRGDWQREIKTSDWDLVIKRAVEALTKRTKDLQIASWLTEGLMETDGFNGLATGLGILTGFLRDYWEHLYPEIEDGDLDFRAAPIESMNDKLWPSIKQISITDRRVTPGYSWFKWQESRQVGYEANSIDKYGSVDGNKKKARDELIAEGKLTAEDFDAAVALSSRTFYESLAENLSACFREFKAFDKTVDEKFDPNPPKLAEFRGALEDCERLIMKILKEKRQQEPNPEPEPQKEEIAPQRRGATGMEETEMQPSPQSESTPETAVPSFRVEQFSDSGSQETAMWLSALETLKSSGISQALGMIHGASCRAASVRESKRYRLLMARLCLRAERPDLARPIVEELYSSIEELNLERWESPIWIADVLDALYRCLTSGEPSDEDSQRAKVLFQKLCTTDVTKAMAHRQ